MNENDEYYLQGVYKFHIPLFIGTNPFVLEKISVSRALQFIEFGFEDHKENVEYIRKRIPVLSDQQYKEEKSANLKHISIHCDYLNGYREGKNIVNLTGLVLVEFDNIPTSELADLKKSLLQYNFVIAAYESVSRRGVHAWVHVSGIDNIDDYKAAWKQLAILFYNHLGKKVCTGSNNTTQLICLSYDPKILYNEEPIPYRFCYDELAELDYCKSFGTIKCQINNEEYDLPSLDSHLYSNYRTKFIDSYYYYKQVLCEKTTGEPIQYGNVKYNPEMHVFKKSFSKMLISTSAISNDSNTVGRCEYMFAAFKLYMNHSRKFIDGKRKDSLMAWLINYAFAEQLERRTIDLNQLVALAHMLNDNVCYDTQLNKEPINARHLNFVINCVWQKIELNSIEPNFTGSRYIYNNDLMRECGSDKDITFIEVYKKEISKLRNTHHQINVHEKISAWENAMTASKTKLKSKSEMYNSISEFHRVHINTASNWVEYVQTQKGANAHNHVYLLLILSDIVKHGTFNKMDQIIDELIREKAQIKQEIISIRSGVSLRSVKRHWPKFKNKINAHKNIIKTMSKKKDNLPSDSMIKILQNSQNSIRSKEPIHLFDVNDDKNIMFVNWVYHEINIPELFKKNLTLQPLKNWIKLAS